MTQTAGVYAETEELAGLKEFLKKSPTAFHAADTIRRAFGCGEGDDGARGQGCASAAAVSKTASL